MTMLLVSPSSQRLDLPGAKLLPSRFPCSDELVRSKPHEELEFIVARTAGYNHTDFRTREDASSTATQTAEFACTSSMQPAVLTSRTRVQTSIAAIFNTHSTDNCVYTVNTYTHIHILPQYSGSLTVHWFEGGVSAIMSATALMEEVGLSAGG